MSNQSLVTKDQREFMFKTTKARKGCCYFCGKKWKEDKDQPNTCANCKRLKDNLFCPMVFDNCRICNRRIIIATGEQPLHKKQGYCTIRCAGEWTLGTSDAMPYQEMMVYG